MSSTKRQVEIRTTPLTVGEDEWVVRTNLTVRQTANLTSGIPDRAIEAMRELVREHPFVDADGAPLDPADIPDEDMAELMKAYSAYRRSLPPASAPAT